jgi:hypothetical protein
MVWGIAVVALLGLAVWWLWEPGGGGAPLARAFGVLAAYGLLFWATLLKVWWTAGRPAVVVGEEALAYQPLHTFRPRRLPYSRLLAVSPRAGTQSLRLVVAERRGPRELFLNLAVVDGRHRFLDQLGERLRAAGLGEAPGGNAWERPAPAAPAGGSGAG